MAKKRKKRRLRAAKIPAGQLADQRYNTPCPKCESKATLTVGLGGRYAEEYECRSCGHEWMNQAAQESAQREKEAADMAKKKAKKAVKSAVKKTLEKKPIARRKKPLPRVGTVLKATYKGKEYKATVVKDGIKYKDKVFTSVSKVSSEISNGHCTNGRLFFKLDA